MIMKSCIKSPYNLRRESHEVTTVWGKLLISTGGILKPPKSFHYLVDYEWQADGSWEYSDLMDFPARTVPQPDGSEVPIDRLPVDESRKTLGIWTNPAGDCQKQLDVLHDNLEKWTNRILVGRLPAKWA